GTIWVSGSHENRAAVATLIQGKWSRHIHHTFAPDISPASAHVGRDGWVYFGADSGRESLSGFTGGVLRCRIQEGTLQHETFAPPTVPARVLHIVQDSGHNFWL